MGLRAFWLDRSLPSGVTGPCDLRPLVWLAARRRAEKSSFRMRTDPILHLVAVSFRYRLALHFSFLVAVP
jgi:hypothetical protein